MSLRLSIRFGKQLLQELLAGNFAILSKVKYFSKWKHSLKPGISSTTQEQPWITYPVIDFLNRRINSHSKVFEYGGGGSTLFFVNRASVVVTVEHDAAWFSKLQQIISNKSIKNWTGNLILPEKTTSTKDLDPSDPEHYYTTDLLFKDNTFKSYASFIDRYPEGYFDMVLVDGRSRPSCAFHAFHKIKKGGYLVIDNSDRQYYFTKINKILQTNFELVYNKKDPSPYAEFFTKTGIWRRL